MTILIWPRFYFLHFMILMSFLLNLIKDWNVPNPLMETIYHLLILAIRKSFIYYLCLLSLFSLFLISYFFFLCHVIFAHNILKGIFAMTMVFPLSFA